MPTLSSPGIGSGLDVNGIVTQLMTLERLPLTQLATKQTSYKTQLSAIGQLQGVISAFQTAAKSMESAGSSPSYSVTSGDNSIFTTSVTGKAVPGNYAIGVTQLAQAQKIAAVGVADKTATIGAGTTTTLTIDFGTISGGTFNSGTGIYTGASFTANTAKTPVNIQITSTNNTLEGIRDAINTANAGVSASIVNDGSGTPYRLVLTSKDTGAINSVRIGVAGDAALQSLLAYDPTATQNLSQLQNAQDAHLSVDGINITRASNTVTNAVDGVTLNLTGIKASGTTQLSVQQDNSVLTKAVNALVTAYNNVNQLITSATAKDAPLQGDPVTATIQRQLRTALGNSITTTSAYKSLASLNIVLQRDGTLAVDAAKLQTIVNSNYADASAVVAAFGTSLAALSKNILDSGTGLIANQTSGINAAIKENTNQQDVINQRLVSVEARYRAQYSSLDTLLASMSHTSSFLQQQFYRTTSNNSGG